MSSILYKNAFLILLIVFAGFASATVVYVDVAEVIQGDIKIVENSSANGVFYIESELYNTGSVGYSARMRVDISNTTGYVLYRGWSGSYELAPGDRKTFRVHWAWNESGNFTAKVVFYYANEIVDGGTLDFQISNISGSKDIFRMENFRTYEEYVRFDLKANTSVEDVIVFPSRYPAGWIFEQARLESIEKDGRKEVVLPYEPSFFSPRTVEITAVTKDGKYLTKRYFVLKREKGIIAYFHKFMDSLRRLTS